MAYKKRSVGLPYKYTKTKAKKFVYCIENLMGIVESCKEIGIVYVTYRNWYNKIPEFKESVDEALENATQTGKEFAIKKIFTAMDTNWTAAAWWLERQHNEEFGKKDRLEQTTTFTEPIKINVIAPTPEPERIEGDIQKKLN